MRRGLRDVVRDDAPTDAFGEKNRRPSLGKVFFLMFFSFRGLICIDLWVSISGSIVGFLDLWGSDTSYGSCIHGWTMGHVKVTKCEVTFEEVSHNLQSGDVASDIF